MELRLARVGFPFGIAPTRSPGFPYNQRRKVPMGFRALAAAAIVSILARDAFAGRFSAWIGAGPAASSAAAQAGVDFAVTPLLSAGIETGGFGRGEISGTGIGETWVNVIVTIHGTAPGLRPVLRAGFGAYRIQPDSFVANQTKPGGFLGAGVQAPLLPWIAFEAILRYHLVKPAKSSSESVDASFWEPALGFRFFF
jgi:hypothetical protein